MPETRDVEACSEPRTVLAENGQKLTVPDEWELLPPGDAALTRRVKASGPHWTMIEKKGRRRFSRGVWASAETIAAIRSALAAERATPAYASKRQNDLRRREHKQAEYVGSFHEAVRTYLAFAPAFTDLAEQLARAVTEHATPVGSGTVARTQRIPIERRAKAAVLAWMRHQTTNYDNLKIERRKGRRHEVRRQLAQQSLKLLAVYRSSGPADMDSCPLQIALRRRTNSETNTRTHEPAA
ncbi:MAG: DUF2293 domain-containing protein [Planctomycetota bacterium]|nr:DUF2293 domain-containing protein [Planctomycetaceae bacterium]MDQ3331042.1 DUF2293 domain-containing protein [Planctomycetota bacterium]